MSATSKSPAEDVAKLLTDAGYTSVQVGKLLDTPDAIIVVYDSGGLPSDKAHGSKNVAFELPRVQVVVRDRNPKTAYERCYALYRLLDGERAQTINDNTYDLFDCLQPPYKHGEDASERTRYAFNVQITRRPA